MNMYRLAVGITLAAAFAQGAELSADFSAETGAVRRALHSFGCRRACRMSYVARQKTRDIRK